MSEPGGAPVDIGAAVPAVPWCWMCDRDRAVSPRASEHVFPQWLARRTPGRELTVDEIRPACNSGWMEP